MIFTETKLRGAYVIDVEPRTDHRGFFARTWCQREFAAQGLQTLFVQTNVAHSHRRGTLRGMHYQAPPFEETKLVACVRGGIYDVILDLRNDSATYGQWVSFEVDAVNGRMLYVPRGCAHGYQTLTDDAFVTYQVSQFHSPDHERGVRFDDPAFAIQWPLPVSSISSRDSCHSDYVPATTDSIESRG